MTPPGLFKSQISPKFWSKLLDYKYIQLDLLIMLSKILATLFIALIISTTAFAGPVYKWTDQGRVIYSQTPPKPGVEFEIVFQDELGVKKTSVAKADSSASNSGSSFEERREERKKSEADKKVQEESNKIKAENCAIATQNMQSLISRGQVTIKDGDIYRKLSEDERQAKIDETKSQVSEYCDS